LRRDVDRRAVRADRPALGIELEAAVVQDPARPAIGKQDAVFAAVPAALARSETTRFSKASRSSGCSLSRMARWVSRSPGEKPKSSRQLALATISSRFRSRLKVPTFPAAAAVATWASLSRNSVRSRFAFTRSRNMA
jgi:hypothetical protein